MKVLTTAIGGFLLVLMAGCAPEGPDLAAERSRLLELDREWSSIASAGEDVEAILAYWADDAIVMPPGMPTVVGKDAIRQYVASSLEIPGFEVGWEPTGVVEFSPDGQLAYMLGENHFTMNDPEGNPLTSYGKGVTVWRKEADGSWKCVLDIWNEKPATEGASSQM